MTNLSHSMVRVGRYLGHQQKIFQGQTASLRDFRGLCNILLLSLYVHEGENKSTAEPDFTIWRLNRDRRWKVMVTALVPDSCWRPSRVSELSPV